jgi:SHS2 domain-containing protein
MRNRGNDVRRVGEKEKRRRGAKGKLSASLFTVLYCNVLYCTDSESTLSWVERIHKIQERAGGRKQQKEEGRTQGRKEGGKEGK